MLRSQDKKRAKNLYRTYCATLRVLYAVNKSTGDGLKRLFSHSFQMVGGDVLKTNALKSAPRMVFVCLFYSLR